jgi:retron-type reverse transcriptase
MTLRSGVMVDGVVETSEEGTTQGGVISPILSNVYLHEVLGTWFTEQVIPRLKGKASLVRFADDAVMILSNERDAKRALEVLPKRFAKYGLTVHPEKTQMIRFTRPHFTSGGRGPTSPFLGFTHFWGRSQKGNWVAIAAITA